jgi:hypothetical protein
VLPTSVKVEPDSQEDHCQGNRAIANDFLPMLFKERYCMFDFERKLIRFQFFPGDSCQTKTSDCMELSPSYHGVPAPCH